MTDKKYGWDISSRIFLFEFDLDERDDLLKKRVYESSLSLNNTFEKLQAREDITLTTPSNYYEKKIDKNLRCIQTAKKIKYKGKICINPIDVDKDKYFSYGTFETKEHNFIAQNQKIFEALAKLDKELKKKSQEYAKYLLLKVKELESEKAFEDKKSKTLNLEGGL